MTPEAFVDQIRVLLRASKPVAVVLRGAPGAGKTTLARQLALLDSTALVTSADDYRTASDGSYHWSFDTVQSCAEKAKARWRSETKERRCRLLVSDNVNVESGTWYRLRASEAGYEVVAPLIVAPASVCVARQIHDVPLRFVGDLCRRVDSLRRADPAAIVVETS